MEQAARGVCRIAGVGAKSSSLGAEYGSASPSAWLHAPWEATFRTQTTGSGLPLLILSVYETGRGSLISPDAELM